MSSPERSGDEGDGDGIEEARGFCHMNDRGSQTAFVLEIGGHVLEVRQDPSCEHKDLGHGAVVWDAAIIFAKYLEIDKQFSGAKMQDKRVVELGSGTGLAGFSLMLKGAHCTLTDLAPVVEHMTAPNAKAVFAKVGSSGSSSVRMHRPTTEVCDWTQDYPPPDEPYDVVLLTDCVFSPHLARPLVGQLLRLTGPSSTVLCCHEIRDEEANAAFVAELAAHFQVKTISKKKLHPDFRNDQVQLLQARSTRVRGDKDKNLKEA
jgi:predicted nicotinamide N-methyase